MPELKRLLSEVNLSQNSGGPLGIHRKYNDLLPLKLFDKLRRPEFLTRGKISHGRRFHELHGFLEGIGFVVQTRRGNFLLKDYGIPKLGSPEGKLTRDKPETVAIFRLLGERAWSEFGIEYTIAAKKAA